jgi:thermitase
MENNQGGESMMKITSFILTLLVATQIHAAEYIIKQRTMNLKSLDSVEGLKVLDSHAPGRLVQVDIPVTQEISVLANLHNDPNVEYVVENFQLQALTAPLSAADFVVLQEQWANQKVNIDRAWQLAGNRGNRNVTIAVIDTGVDYRHPNLASNMVPGYDFLGRDNDPMDEIGTGERENPGHGTHCTGSIAANGNVEGGIIGAVPVVNIMPLRFLGVNGGGNLMDGIRAIDYAIEHRVQIISASWGAKVGRSQAAPLVEAVQRADAAGIIFVAAAANAGTNNDQDEYYPANAGFPNTIAVAASDINDAKPQWSNFGKKTVHIASPGLNIMSTIPNNRYRNLSGTSMATPLVAGIVGLIKAQKPEMTGAEVRALLQTTGVGVSIETACNCRVDAGAAMEALKTDRMFMVPTAAALKVQETVQLAVKNGVAPFTYVSTNPSAVTVSESGLVSAVAAGTARLSVKDARQVTINSMDFHVSAASQGGGECPLGDPMYCELLCGIMPELPFCQQ